MERALFVPDLDRMPPEGGRYDRLYLGSEFCSSRLPSGGELSLALETAGGCGVAFSLVTPLLDEPGLRRSLALVRSLPTEGTTEVVVNDLGLLEAIAESGWRGNLVVGRLLSRQRRGPSFQEPIGAPREALEVLRGSTLDSPAFVAWIRERYGVRRFEIDDLAQGVAVGDLPEGLGLSLYQPYLLVTATRNCPWVFDGRTWDHARGCARPCRGRVLTLEPEEGGRSLLLGGCAQFLRADNPLGLIPPGVDRVVWQPDIPS